MLQSSEFRIGYFLRWYWRTNDFSRIIRNRLIVETPTSKRLRIAVRIGVLLQVAIGLALIILWGRYDINGGWQFGLAIILSYPIVWAHALALMVAASWLRHPKAVGRAIVCGILERQVRRLRARHNFSVVAVVGSVGKTSTKMAIASLLQGSRQVRWQEGNYNDRVTVPLIFFGHTAPRLMDVFAWVRIFWQNERIIARPYPYQAVIAELGTDGPGFMREFAYIRPELVVVTSVAPEHMAYFGTLDAVAREELAALNFAHRALVNIDDTPAQYLVDRNFVAYGSSADAAYRLIQRKAKGFAGQELVISLRGHNLSLNTNLLGYHGAKTVLAAAATADMLGLGLTDIATGLSAVAAVAGRMQILHGIKNTTIIDDTYNSSPEAAKAALDVLQSGDAPQRIAILGSMNELGAYSQQAHQEIGQYCDPAKLDLVVTVGADAQNYLAPAAKQAGCVVRSYLDPYKAGRYVKKQLQESAVILAKGSQNGVFTEEALKVLLADKADAAKLVRQSKHWMRLKQKQFKQ